MSEQVVRGRLASGNSFRASPDGVEILDPSGQLIASFGREVISGVSRDGQVVTLERFNDTIVTITAASVAEAHDLEQFVAAQLAAPETFTPLEPEPEPAPPPPTYEPVVPPPAEPELAAPPPPPPAPSVAEQRVPGGSGYAVTPEPAPARTGGGQRWLLWGCLGCGGLTVLCLVTFGVLLATGAIDVDEFDDDDEPTATIVSVIEPSATPGSDPAATAPGGAEATRPGDPATAAPPANGDVLQPGQTAQVEGVDITFVESRIDDAPIFEPEAGNEFLILRFTVANNSAEEYIVSTLLQFTLLDSSGNSYPQSFFAGTEGQIDGTLAAGGTVEGEIAYEVPQGGGPYIVRFEGFLGDDAATWLVEPGN